MYRALSGHCQRLVWCRSVKCSSFSLWLLHCHLALFLATISLHILYAPPTPICCRSLGSTQPLLPVVSALLSPQYGTHSLLAFTLVLHHILSVVFLKPTVSIRSSVPSSGSHNWLRFGLWSTLSTIKELLTYLSKHTSQLIFTCYSYRSCLLMSSSNITPRTLNFAENSNDNHHRNLSRCSDKHMLFMLVSFFRFYYFIVFHWRVCWYKTFYWCTCCYQRSSLILFHFETELLSHHHHHHYSACTMSVRSSACYQ